MGLIEKASRRWLSAHLRKQQQGLNDQRHQMLIPFLAQPVMVIKANASTGFGGSSKRLISSKPENIQIRQLLRSKRAVLAAVSWNGRQRRTESSPGTNARKRDIDVQSNPFQSSLMRLADG